MKARKTIKQILDAVDFNKSVQIDFSGKNILYKFLEFLMASLNQEILLSM